MPLSQTNTPNVALSIHPGDFLWRDTENIGRSDDAWVLCRLESDYLQSEWLWSFEFGFSLPTGATIDGIEIEVERHSNIRTSIVSEIALAATSGEQIGESKSLEEAWRDRDDEVVIYGSASDRWGATLTHDIVNLAKFGCKLRCYGLEKDIELLIDTVRMTVYYTEYVAPETYGSLDLSFGR